MGDAVNEMVSFPWLGVEKKGDLSGVLIHKFILQKSDYLLAYRVIAGQSIELIMIGPMKTTAAI